MPEASSGRTTVVISPGQLQSRPTPADDIQETIPGVPPRETAAPPQEACLVQIYPVGPGMGVRHCLSDAALALGRDAACPVSLDDPSVSRRHAEVRPGIAGYCVVDLGSTNGTFVNDRRVSLRKLVDGDYVRVGNAIFRYLAGGNLEAAYHEEIYRLTISDALTGAHNKRAFLEFLDREATRSLRHGRPLALVMMDIDWFKSVNDRLGHLAGDAVLREVAARLRGQVRREELFARYGGEEFAVVMPETAYPDARGRAEEWRRLIADRPCCYDSQVVPVTISLGLVASPGRLELSPEELILRADEQLYRAKQAGRNRVEGELLAGPAPAGH